MVSDHAAVSAGPGGDWAEVMPRVAQALAAWREAGALSRVTALAGAGLPAVVWQNRVHARHRQRKEQPMRHITHTPSQTPACGRPGRRRWPPRGRRRACCPHCCAAATSCCPALRSLTPSSGPCPGGCAGRCNGSGGCRWLAWPSAGAGAAASAGGHDPGRGRLYSGGCHHGGQHRHGHGRLSGRQWGGHDYPAGGQHADPDGQQRHLWAHGAAGDQQCDHDWGQGSTIARDGVVRRSSGFWR